MFGVESPVRSESGNTVSEAYDPEEKILRIKFRSGKSWDYHGVTGALYKSFKESPEQGKFLHRIIKPACPAGEVK